MKDDEMKRALELATDCTDTECTVAWNCRYVEVQLLARALLASQAECERMTEAVRLIRLQLHVENNEEATVMIDELAHSRGIS